MPRRFLCYFNFVLLFICPSQILAIEDGVSNKNQRENYFKIKAGLVQPTAIDGNTGLGSGDTTYAVGATIGRRFNALLSFDIEYMFRGESTSKYHVPNEAADPVSWKAKSNTYMANMNVNLMLNSRITPYLRFGMGMSQNKPSTYIVPDNAEAYRNTHHPGKTTKNFAWQAGSGINFMTNDSFSVDLEYMYVNRGHIETEAFYTNGMSITQIESPALKGNLIDHVFTVGFKFNF
jgi:opacity protein-like surface antigen